jgi:hypothetical protein
MVHCFQGALYPDEASFCAAAAWVIEGSAEWASATLVGPDALDTQVWQRYLAQPGESLFKKAYDAMPFYAHLEETGHSPWAAFRAMWATKGNAAQFAKVGGTNSNFLDTWASSISRKGAFGSTWDTTGPGITEGTGTRYPLVVGKMAAKGAAAPYTNRIYAIAANTDLIDVSMVGHARLADGLIDELSLGSKTFCLRSEECKCPDGSSPESATALQGTGALLALTGGSDAARGTVTGRDLDCKGKGASWHFDSPSSYSGGPAHTVVDAYTCASLRGTWQAILHVAHTPATSRDPALDRLVKFTWTFGRDGRATPIVGPYQDTVFGTTHTIVYYPVIQLDEAKGTITVVGMDGSEDGSKRIDVGYQLARLGETVPVVAGKSPKCSGTFRTGLRSLRPDVVSAGCSRRALP